MYRTIALAALLALPGIGCGDDDTQANDNNGNQNDNVPISCGNGTVEGLEECDEGAQNSDTEPDACRSNCMNPYCGDGVTDADEECDDAGANSDEVADACRTTCLLPSCGDGVIDSSETCDDAGDNSDTTPNACRSYCVIPYCGDGVTDDQENETCDDGGVEPHDGCSDICQTEALTWSRIGEDFKERSYHDMVYDSARGVIVMFGGEDQDYEGLNDTWEYDGTLWQRVHTADSPGIRRNHAMAYDSQRQRVVLFGGLGNCPGTNGCYDTWEYDGTNWVEIATADHPPAMHMHRLVYDSARGVVVLHGGQSGLPGFAPPLSGTWEYDGTNWTERTFTTPPPGRREFGMAYDASRSRTVVWGGKCFDGTFTTYCGSNPVYEYDGTSWTPVYTFTPYPSSRTEHVMAYRPTGEVVLYGGFDSTSDWVVDTWLWHGSYWEQVNPGDEPGARNGAAMAYGAAWNRMVLFDGYGTGDTWELDGATWSRAKARPNPSSRGRQAAAYDPSRGVTVLFGGQPWSYALADTWEFDGSAWSETTPAVSPASRWQHTMAYDPAGQQVILFGGYSELASTVTNDTWVYDGVTWEDVSSASSPPARRLGAMAADPTRSRVVLFGGSAGAGVYLADTWEWDGSGWSQVFPTTSPPAMSSATMTYDPLTSRVVLFGGYTGSQALDGVWAFDGTDWVELQMSAVNPEPRWTSAFGFHDAAGVLVAYAGVDLGQEYDDLWTASGTTWTELSPSLAPEPRHDIGNFVYHAEIHALLLFGGRGNGGTLPYYQDTWILRLDEAP